jgi:methyl-accepting chemotaxis protein
MNLNRIKTGPRLTLGFGLVLALMALMVAIGYTRLVSSEKALHHLVELERRAGVANEWRALTELNAARTFAIAKSGNNTAVVEYFDPLIKATSAEITRRQDDLSKAVDSDRGKELLTKVASERSAYIATRDEVFKMLKTGDPAGAGKVLAERMAPAAQSYIGAIAALATYQGERVEKDGAQVQRELQAAEMQLLMLLGIGLVVAAGAGWLITRSVTRPLEQAVAEMEVFAGGDLSVRFSVEGRDEVAQLKLAIVRMQGQLQELVRGIRQSAESIQVASTEVAVGNADLSGRTEQAASNLQQTASSMEQLTGTVKHTADSARTANQLAGSAAEVARRGGEVVSQVVATMEDINQASRKIADIIGTIDGIAFQTNILALNAAVEAARAGEQGRGFAVVAGEVRNLAQRSAEAAKEIKSLIGSSVDKVDAGTRLVGRSRVDDGRHRVPACAACPTLIDEINTCHLRTDRGHLAGQRPRCRSSTRCHAAERSAGGAERSRGRQPEEPGQQAERPGVGVQGGRVASSSRAACTVRSCRAGSGVPADRRGQGGRGIGDPVPAAAGRRPGADADPGHDARSGDWRQTCRSTRPEGRGRRGLGDLLSRRPSVRVCQADNRHSHRSPLPREEFPWT